MNGFKHRRHSDQMEDSEGETRFRLILNTTTFCKISRAFRIPRNNVSLCADGLGRRMCLWHPFSCPFVPVAAWNFNHPFWVVFSFLPPRYKWLLLCGLWGENAGRVSNESLPGHLAQRLLSVSLHVLFLTATNTQAQTNKWSYCFHWKGDWQSPIVFGFFFCLLC